MTAIPLPLMMPAVPEVPAAPDAPGAIDARKGTASAAPGRRGGRGPLILERRTTGAAMSSGVTTTIWPSAFVGVRI